MTDLATVLDELILGPAHVGFVVPDLAEAVAQARRLYGIPEEAVHYHPAQGDEAPSRFAFFRIGGLDFEYIQPCSEDFRAQMLGRACGAGGINHLAWRVSDIERAVTLLAEHGILPGYVTPDGIVAIGATRMVYLDPATTGGLLVELIQQGE